MIRLIHKEDLELITHLPSEVIEVASNILTVLDDEYGVDRNYRSDLGGYLVIVERSTDLISLVDDGIDIWNDIPEYVDIIDAGGGRKYTNLLILMNNDYGIGCIIPLELIPLRLLEWVVQ
jgi:hypothetical protein